jgi:hypothetical protein
VAVTSEALDVEALAASAGISILVPVLVTFLEKRGPTSIHQVKQQRQRGKVPRHSQQRQFVNEHSTRTFLLILHVKQPFLNLCCFAGGDDEDCLERCAVTLGMSMK